MKYFIKEKRNKDYLRQHPNFIGRSWTINKRDIGQFSLRYARFYLKECHKQWKNPYKFIILPYIYYNIHKIKSYEIFSRIYRK